MKNKLLLLLSVLLILVFTAAPTPIGGGPIGPVPPSDVAYNAVTWNGSFLAPTQNAVRDQFVASAAAALQNVVEDTTPQLGGDLDGQTYNMVTTGAITGAVGVITTTGIDLSAAQSYGYAIIATAAGDVELADVCDTATGANALIFVRDVAETVSIAINDPGDTIVFPGLSLGADDELDSAGNAGDFVGVVCLEANTWYVIGSRGGWTDGGAAD